MLMYIITLRFNSTFGTIGKATGIKMKAKVVGHPEDCHLDVVGVLARSNEPESYAGWTSQGPGRDTHAIQVKG